ncbi:MAG: bifunctional diaminohydroxyphosphoribosylaminopyrimidine deaminase/5-amino-6-(5-phosphoribosylamino)uracil reductase RibD [Alphaproteobacteria bacterium]|nr:bifunctional diaminohydroxyphosphoribosylaminopyrimidine deaminase/5-amino-6-(5-phosphoribosylamino)uracil reductase RibD [Alphaproteobacteria bacterium]
MGKISKAERHFLEFAIDLASRQVRSVRPNPAVGCVLIQPSGHGSSAEDPLGFPKPLAIGVTATGGRPHAETQAIAQARAAGHDLQGATALVSLEPCCHHGKTPPCTEALIAAGVKRVVVAIQDPDPRVSGKGVAALRQAGVTVELCAEEPIIAAAAEVILGFANRITTGRPMVTLKLAMSLDGRIATAEKESQWITGPLARQQTHLLRARHDAIMVGTATVLADNPRLDVRLPGLEHLSPLKVIIDRRRSIPQEYQIFTPPALLVTRELGSEEQEFFRSVDIHLAEYFQRGKTYDGENSQIMLKVLELLGEAGLNSVLVEGGGKLAANLLNLGLVDRLVLFRAPILLGAAGVPAVGNLEVQKLADHSRWQPLQQRPVGTDTMEVYRRLTVPPLV